MNQPLLYTLLGKSPYSSVIWTTLVNIIVEGGDCDQIGSSRAQEVEKKAGSLYFISFFISLYFIGLVISFSKDTKELLKDSALICPGCVDDGKDTFFGFSLIL